MHMLMACLNIVRMGNVMERLVHHLCQTIPANVTKSLVDADKSTRIGIHLRHSHCRLFEQGAKAIFASGQSIQHIIKGMGQSRDFVSALNIGTHVALPGLNHSSHFCQCRNATAQTFAYGKGFKQGKAQGRADKNHTSPNHGVQFLGNLFPAQSYPRPADVPIF